MRQVVFSEKNKCRVCYTCVRECPAKAIKITNGQAEVIPERCISCGKCTQVCRQHVKYYLRSVEQVYRLLENEKEVIACIDPAFAAEFDKYSNRTLIGMIRELGFYKVVDTSIGADIIAEKYKKYFSKDADERYISSFCPSIVKYVRFYHPKLVKHLAPIETPLQITTQILKHLYGEKIKIVYIGPCIAKKATATSVNEVITFRELRQMFFRNEISPYLVKTSTFDEPIGGKGSMISLRHGLSQVMGNDANPLTSNVILAEGRNDFQEALRDFEKGYIDTMHLDLLTCKGCIMGPGMTGRGKQYSRTIKVINYVRDKMFTIDKDKVNYYLSKYRQFESERNFIANDKRFERPSKETLNKILVSTGKISIRDHLDCKACGYDSCMEHSIAINSGLAEPEMCLPYIIEKLHKYIEELGDSNKKLASVQMALKQSEKLAGMGQLSAGIAHELNNPLGVVIMYTNILLEEAEKGSQHYDDLQLIVEQAERCKKIVSGLLNFARKNQTNFEDVDLTKLIETTINGIIIDEKIKIIKNITLKNKYASLDKEQMIQALSNLIRNAVEAMHKKGKIIIKLTDKPNEIKIQISDTGTGIKAEYLSKIFEPFFTTKGIGKGTGLGLATTYGIVKMHKGQITVTSNTNIEKAPTGTTFSITLPRHKSI